MFKKISVVTVVFFFLVSAITFAQTETTKVESSESANQRPNILLVLLDDAGFMDFGAYGSDTATPTIDKIGQQGAMFTRYYTLPLCGPSRASLLTGQSNHEVGAGTLTEVLNAEMRAMPAYSMTWKDEQQTIATRLKSAGYQTFVSGKWGIGNIGANLPHRFGFDKTWVLDSTGSSNYRAKSYLPHYKEVKWFENGERVSLPDDFYSSRNIVDKMIDYVNASDSEAPFFGYLSFQAVHIPVQVSLEYIEKYDGVFDRGWDIMREERLRRAIDIGLVPESTQLAEAPYNARKWSDLSQEEKAYWARVMQANAGMMESADYHLGRLLEHLEEKGRLDNTIVIVLSDNGPEYNTLGKTSEMPALLIEKVFMAVEGWDVDYDNIGQLGSIAGIGQEWATVSAAPFHLFKFATSEGGTRVPLVISGPGIKPLGYTDNLTQVADITPTLLDFAGVKYDPNEFYGRSQAPVLRGETDEVYGANDSFVFEVSGAAALYRANWKIVKNPTPKGSGKWHLFDISKDPGETTDLASEYPELFEDMLAEYKVYEDRYGVYQVPEGESGRKQLVINALIKISVNYWYLLVGSLLIVIGSAYGIYRFCMATISRKA